MTATINPPPTAAATGRRGPADHMIRDQIIAAADTHFSHYGYGKTTVADLAKAVGFSKAYIYKFFDSKQAIGEAICARCLESMLDRVHQATAGARTATERLRLLLRTVTVVSLELFFAERKLYDIVTHACEEQWPASESYVEEIGAILVRIIQEGREAGEFERKTPIDEASRAILMVFQPFMNPLMLQHGLDGAAEASNEVASLVLRSLAP